jgi:hypothetical protein
MQRNPDQTLDINLCFGDVLRAGIPGSTESRHLFANVIPAPAARQPNTADQLGGGRTATQRIVPNAAFRLTLSSAAPAAAPAPAASPAPTPSVPTLFDVKTIHAAGPCSRSGQGRSSRCGAVANRAKAVDREYQHKARALDADPAVRRHNGGSTDAVSGTLRALGTVRGLVFGQYGEASEDVHRLLGAAAVFAAKSEGRQHGAPSGTLARLTALFMSQLRRAWGVNTVREMARHRLVRIPLIGAPRGTRLAQASAPVASAAALFVL